MTVQHLRAGWSNLGRLLLLPALAAAQAWSQPIEFTTEKWDLTKAEVKDHLGRRALSGSASLKGASFQDGVIEFDLAVEHKRSFPGVSFRIQDDENCERVYFRPHHAGHYADAIQYLPAFSGVDAWQLYNGDGYTAGVALPENRWIHVRLEVMGRQARVFVGGETRPALVVHELKRGVSSGGVSLSTPRDGSAYISNFAYTNASDLRFDPPPAVVSPVGAIVEWSLSQAFPPNQVDFETTPAAQGLEVQWQRATAEQSGLLDISRYVRPLAGGASCVFAKTILRAQKREVRRLAFGYSDAITLLVNGRPVFRGSSAYRERDSTFLGAIGLSDSAYLPLERGENEIIAVISDSTGGWGLMARDVSTVYQHKALTKLWDLPRRLRTPESIAYDRKRGVFYVSNFRNDGKEFISKLGLDGTILALEWVTGLNRPTGVRVQGDKLYVVERSGVAEIDIDAGRIARRLPLAGADFPNDLTLDERGAIYVTDGPKRRIYRIEDGNATIWLESDELAQSNGILADGTRLLVGVSSDATIKAIDLQTKRVTTLVKLGGRAIMDGLVSDGRGGYLISDYSGRIYRVSASGEKELLLDRTGPRQFCADFEYIPEKGLLLVPSLSDNRITAYRYQ
jgi:sugar lactone lactonase YvrE